MAAPKAWGHNGQPLFLGRRFGPDRDRSRVCECDRAVFTVEQWLLNKGALFQGLLR